MLSNFPDVQPDKIMDFDGARPPQESQNFRKFLKFLRLHGPTHVDPDEIWNFYRGFPTDH
jgi:predicted Ser/Thr protein kinase